MLRVNPKPLKYNPLNISALIDPINLMVNSKRKLQSQDCGRLCIGLGIPGFSGEGQGRQTHAFCKSQELGVSESGLTNTPPWNPKP